MPEDSDRLTAKEERRRRRLAAQKKQKKSRKKRNPSKNEEEEEEEEEDEDVGMPTWKTGAVIAVIIGCFAILYPKMFHPMLMFVLGMNRKDPEPDPKYPHPSIRSAGGPPPGRGFGPDPHILWKSPAKKKSKKYGMHYDSKRERFEVDEDEESTEESEEEPEEEEDPKGKLSNKELKGLQKRLNQTETAMQRILEQLESISGSVDQGTADNVKKMTMDTLNNLARVEADEMVEEVEEAARGSHKRAKNTNDQDGGYLQDLEKALSDFKRFTDNYVQQHSAGNPDALVAAAAASAANGTAAAASGEVEGEPDEEEEEEEEVSELSEEEEEGSEVEEVEEDGSGTEERREDEQQGITHTN